MYVAYVYYIPRIHTTDVFRHVVLRGTELLRRIVFGADADPETSAELNGLLYRCDHKC